nr:hypothetical protein [Pseudomonadota bacterium]
MKKSLGRIFAAHGWRVAAFAVVACIALSPGAARAESMTFENVCKGNNAASCYVRAEGQITAETPALFSSYLKNEHSDGNKVLLHSPGGSLIAGLELGELIRARGMETEIGIWKSEGTFGDTVDGGYCMSACSYAFLGGEVRRIPDGNRLGFHQFYLSGERAGQVPSSQVDQALMSAQELSSRIVRYLLEMGIDARIFVLGTGAKPDDMFVPDAAQLEEFALVTPEGFGAFFLEPYKQGLVAASKRKSATRLYDLASQFSSYCRKNKPYVLITTDGGILNPDNLPTTSINMFSKGRGITATATKDILRVVGDSSVEVEINDKVVELLSVTERIEFSLFLGMSSGGEVRGAIDLSDMDRKIIAASFRFCIG